MALTAISPDVRLQRVTVALDGDGETFHVYYQGTVYNGFESRPFTVETSTSDPDMVGAEATHNDLVADINEIADAFTS